MRDWLNELKGLTWTLGGTAMVLITLSGSTLRRGLLITVVSLGLYLFLTISNQSGEKDE